MNVQNIKTYDTALISFVKRGDYKCVKLLLVSGADKSIKNKDGMLAIAYAKDDNMKKLLGSDINILKNEMIYLISQEILIDQFKIVIKYAKLTNDEQYEILLYVLNKFIIKIY